MTAAPCAGTQAPPDWLAGVLGREPRAVGRAVTTIERGSAKPDTLRRLYRAGGRAHVVGVTGPAGAGKSTLVNQLALGLRRQGHTVAIVAVDPTSPFSGGAILGDRIRMHDLAGDSGVFIRSMATRGALGGLAPAVLDAVDVLDAAGYDVVVLETVGVGQDEVEVVRAVMTVVVVSVPGLGDDIQTMKAGLLEIADLHVVNKVDRAGADRTVAQLLDLVRGPGPVPGRWAVPVLATDAVSGRGVEALLAAIAGHREHLRASGEEGQRARTIAERRVVLAAEALVRRAVVSVADGDGGCLVDRVASRELDPRHAARVLLGEAGRTGGAAR